MSTDARLNRLYPGLMAKERGLLVLKAHRAGEQPDSLVYSTMPNGQGREFKRLAQLIDAVNYELATVLLIVREQVKHIDLKHGWLMSLLRWGMETECLGKQLLEKTKDRKSRSDIRQLIARAPGAPRLPVDLTESVQPSVFEAGYGEGLVRALLVGIKNGLETHWVELRSIEIAVAEVAEEFDGEDPLQADTRAILDEAMATCAKVHADVQVYVEPFVLPDPSDDDVALVRKLIAKATED